MVDHVVEVEDHDASPHIFVETINYAFATCGVSVLIVPSSVGDAKVKDLQLQPLRRESLGTLSPAPAMLTEALALIEESDKITIFAVEGGRNSPDFVMRLAEQLGAPIIRSLKRFGRHATFTSNQGSESATAPIWDRWSMRCQRASVVP